MRSELVVDVVVVKRVSALLSECVIILNHIVKGVSCAMVLLSVKLVQGFGTETQMPRATYGR